MKAFQQKRRGPFETALTLLALRRLPDIEGVAWRQSAWDDTKRPVREAQAVSWLKRLYFLAMGWSPAQAGGERRLVVLALDHVLRTALVEAEHLVIEVEAGHHQAQVVAQSG